jgi:2-polyprenyl-3-methyl-5-hydroxy-6-metoxy-1,4-benzoquinol methylase
MNKLRRIWQDKWFEQWFIRKENLLHVRFIEYAWILRHLIGEGSILDVGCGASFFPLLLALQGYDVTAIDTHAYDYDFPYYKFIQADGATFSSEEKFDAVTIVSSLEHFGIQQNRNINHDVKTIGNLKSLMRYGGRLYVTIPFGRKHIGRSLRVYNQKRVDMLFPEIIKQEYFIREGGFWKKSDEETVAKLPYTMPPNGLTCIVARRS